jgi:uncharacterized repeat protein (TIGR01451 family)
MMRHSLAAALALALASGTGGATPGGKSLLDSTQTNANKPSQPSTVLRAGDLQTASYRSVGERHKLIVDATRRDALLRTASLQRRTDYAAFSMVETDRAGFDTLLAQGAAAADYLNLIQLNAGMIDTLAPQAQALGRQAAATVDGKGMLLIQFGGPMRPEWYRSLEQTGVQIVTAIPSSAYLVYGDAATLQRVLAMRSASAVQFVAPYLPQHRIDAALASYAGGRLAVQLVADAPTNSATLALVHGLATSGVDQQQMLHYVNLEFDADAGAVAQIAARPDVVSIQPTSLPRKMDERQDRIITGFISGNSPTVGDHLAWLASAGFTQAQFDSSNFVVDLTDSGIDNATATPNHFALHRSGVIGQPGRIAYNRLVGTPNSGSTLQGVDGHGTLNSHIIGAYIPGGGVFAAAPHSDAAGYRYDEGVAPFVRIGSSVIFDPDTFTSPNFGTLQSMAYADGARISSNSWGASVAGAYNASSQSYDVLVRDAQSGTSGNQEMVIVFSAGNAGPGASTVGSPGTAKNVITVGASEGVQAFGGADQCGIDDTGADSINDLIFFTSRGPAAGGRKKPDLVGPGTHIGGGVWQNSALDPLSNMNGLAAPAFNATGVCAGPGVSNFWPTGAQQWYTASSGTSHSAPAVAGAAALTRQFFINQGLTPPSPAMTKAMLMNSTRYLNGAGANDNLWSNSQGMGLLDLSRGFDGVARILRDELPSDIFTASGQGSVFVGTVTDASQPFRVTLAWSDAPGPTSGSPQLNDLNLRVTIASNTYFGNVFMGASSITGGAGDTADNVESVFLPAGFAPGTQFVINVDAANIVADGVPGSGPALDQDFALVVYNAQVASIPVIVRDSLILTAENATPPNNAPDPGETLSYDLGLKNVGAANTTDLVATLEDNADIVAPSAPQDYGALIAGGSAVTQPYSFIVDSAVACGTPITLTWHLADGASDLGTVDAHLQTGVLQTLFSEAFDGVTAPAIPVDWLVTHSGVGTPWVTTTTTPDTAPNAAFTDDPNAVSDDWLDSPTFVAAAGGVLSFRKNVNLEIATNPATCYDGAVVEIAINGGAYADIITAGGSFITGAYNCTVAPNFMSPIVNRPAWSGNSGTYQDVRINMPPTATGQSVRLRWRVASDSSVAATGFWIDNVQVSGGYACATAPLPTSSDLAIAITDHRSTVVAGQAVSYAITATNAGQDAVIGARVQVPLPSGLSALSWTCTATGTANCQSASGSGPIDALVDIGTGVGDSVAFTLDATVQNSPEQTISATATITPPAGAIDSNPGNNSATDADPMVIFADGFDPPEV